MGFCFTAPDLEDSHSALVCTPKGLKPGCSERGEQEQAGSPSLEPQDSGADPALLAAIAESLRTARPDGSPAMSPSSRYLSRNLSEADPAVAGQLRALRAAQLHTSPDGITYFDLAGGEWDCPLTLPSFAAHPPAVRQQVLQQLCNDYLQEEAEGAGAINCVPGCTPQLVLNTQGDGNCLSHACSLGVWGIHDRDGQLRSAIRATITHPVVGQDIKLRFERQLEQNGIPQEEWPAEWRRELSAFHESNRMSDRYLSDVHCFTLANVLRRPLLLYGDERAALAGLCGVYLPLLWPPSTCCRDPLALLFWGSHFSLLCTVAGEGPAAPQLLPLCTRDGPLRVRFLTGAEERQHSCRGGTPLPLLQAYMECEMLPEAAAIWRQAQEQRQGEEQQQQQGECQQEGLADAELAPAACCGGVCPPAVGVRLSPSPTPQALLSLLEAAFISQTAAQLGWRRSSLDGGSSFRRRSSLGRADSRRSSLQGVVA